MKTLKQKTDKNQGFESDQLKALTKNDVVKINGGTDGWFIMDYSIIDWTTGEETWHTGHGTGGMIWHSTPGLIA